MPFLLLPFRPSSDPSAAKTFIRNYFFPPPDRKRWTGDGLTKELKMTEVMVIIAVMKWCWARLPGGVVTWEAYQGFKVGERGKKRESALRLIGSNTAQTRVLRETHSAPSSRLV